MNYPNTVEDFLALREENQVAIFYAYEDKYKIGNQSLKKYAKMYKGVIHITPEIIQSQIGEAITITLNKLKVKSLIVKSPKTGKVVRRDFYCEKRRERWLKLLRNNGFEAMKREQALIVKDPYSPEVKKEIDLALKEGRFPKYPKNHPKKEVWVFDYRQRAKEKLKLKKKGFIVEEYALHLKSTAHILHYFRTNFISYIDKAYRASAAQKRNPNKEQVYFQDLRRKDNHGDIEEEYNFVVPNQQTDDFIYEYAEIENKVLEFIQSCDEYFYRLFPKNQQTLTKTYQALLDGNTKGIKNTDKKLINRLLTWFLNCEYQPEEVVKKIPQKELSFIIKNYINPEKYSISLKEFNNHIKIKKDKSIPTLIYYKNDHCPKFINKNQFYEVLDKKETDTGTLMYKIVGRDNDEYWIKADNCSVVGKTTNCEKSVA